MQEMFAALNKAVYVKSSLTLNPFMAKTPPPHPTHLKETLILILNMCSLVQSLCKAGLKKERKKEILLIESNAVTKI